MSEQDVETKFLFDEQPTLAEATEFVGGHVEMLETRFFNATVQLLMNEEGRIHNLPVNHRATNLVGFDLVGNVMVLAGKAKWVD
jgi:hypothetical protein